MSVSAYVEARMWIPDFNNDDVVDSTDMALIVEGFGIQQSSQGWNPIFDANHDSKVNMYDIARTARALGTST
jgi:hypothetical protein